MFKIGNKVQLYKCVFGECEGFCSSPASCNDRLEVGIVISSDRLETIYVNNKNQSIEAYTPFLRQIHGRFEKHKEAICQK